MYFKTSAPLRNSILALSCFILLGPLACSSSPEPSRNPDAGRVAAADAAQPDRPVPVLRPIDGPLMPDALPDLGPDLPPVGPSGLVGHWKFDEGSGSMTNDSAGSLNHGVLLPGATLVAGGFPAAMFPNPGAVALDGVAGRVVLGVNRYPLAESPKTISLWVNYAAVPIDVSAMFSLTNGNESCGVQMGWRGGLLAVWGWAGAVFVSGPYPPPGWHSVIYTFDGTTHSLIVDEAAPITSTALPQACALTDAVISGYAGGGENFAGTIDDFRIYNRVLSAAEISTLARGGDPGAVPGDGGAADAVRRDGPVDGPPATDAGVRDGAP
jgi:hypothetical protein